MTMRRVISRSGVMVGTTPVMIYQVPAGATAKIVGALFMNATQAPTSITVQISHTTGAGTMLTNAFPLAANQPYLGEDVQGQDLVAGDAIMLTAAVDASVTATLALFQTS